MKKVIGADSATLAGLQVDLLQKVRSGRITLDQLERFNNLSFSDREKLFSKGKGKMSVLNTALASIKAARYLDTSFEGKEMHSLSMRALSKEEALAEYKTSGAETWVWVELEQNMPYTTPKAESLEVMMMNFNKGITSDGALAEMDNLGVRPLTYEELIQYGIAHPTHQDQKVLIGLGTKHTLDGYLCAPVLGFVGDGRALGVRPWGNVWDDWCRFPVVRK